MSAETIACEGSREYIGINAPRKGMKPPKSPCPVCGKWVAFHWATGRYHWHKPTPPPTPTEDR